MVAGLSSGAALRGSPLTGGYASAKSVIKLIGAYAGSQSERTRSSIRFVAVLPQLTPATDLGRIYTEAYAGPSRRERNAGEQNAAASAAAIGSLGARNSRLRHHPAAVSRQPLGERVQPPLVHGPPAPAAHRSQPSPAPRDHRYSQWPRTTRSVRARDHRHVVIRGRDRRELFVGSCAAPSTWTCTAGAGSYPHSGSAGVLADRRHREFARSRPASWRGVH